MCPFPPPVPSPHPPVHGYPPSKRWQNGKRKAQTHPLSLRKANASNGYPIVAFRAAIDILVDITKGTTRQTDNPLLHRSRSMHSGFFAEKPRRSINASRRDVLCVCPGPSERNRQRAFPPKRERLPSVRLASAPVSGVIRSICVRGKGSHAMTRLRPPRKAVRSCPRSCGVPHVIPPGEAWHSATPMWPRIKKRPCRTRWAGESWENLPFAETQAGRWAVGPPPPFRRRRGWRRRALRLWGLRRPTERPPSSRIEASGTTSRAKHRQASSRHPA